MAANHVSPESGPRPPGHRLTVAYPQSDLVTGHLLTCGQCQRPLVTLEVEQLSRPVSPLTAQEPGVIKPGRTIVRVSEGGVLNQLQLGVMNSLWEAIMTLVNPGKQLGPV